MCRSEPRLHAHIEAPAEHVVDRRIGRARARGSLRQNDWREVNGGRAAAHLVRLRCARSQYGGSPKQLFRWVMNSGALSACERPGMRTAWIADAENLGGAAAPGTATPVAWPARARRPSSWPDERCRGRRRPPAATLRCRRCAACRGSAAQHSDAPLRNTTIPATCSRRAPAGLQPAAACLPVNTASCAANARLYAGRASPRAT